jgi:glyoxylase-like metal-dependent hydrolase (beta-lactamase superfamily II)
MFQTQQNDSLTILKMGRTLLGKPLRFACAFIIDGLVIDGGCPYFREQLGDYFTAHPPQQAVFTHHHEDHAGNVDLFNRINITPFAHAEAVEKLASPTRIPYYRRFTWGNPAYGQCRIAGSVIETNRYHFEVIATPGHSSDHIALYEPKQGWLFTGDLFVSEKIIYLYENENLPSMRESLRKLAELDFSLLACSHRGVLKKGPEALLRKAEYIESMQCKARELHGRGYPEPEITKILLGKEDYMYLISRGEFSKTAFIRALLQ